MRTCIYAFKLRGNKQQQLTLTPFPVRHLKSYQLIKTALLVVAGYFAKKR